MSFHQNNFPTEGQDPDICVPIQVADTPHSNECDSSGSSQGSGDQMVPGIPLPHLEPGAYNDTRIGQAWETARQDSSKEYKA